MPASSPASVAVSSAKVRAAGERVLVIRVALPPFRGPGRFPAGSGYLGRATVPCVNQPAMRARSRSWRPGNSGRVIWHLSIRDT